jgi:adenosylcobinamide kinase/adenosylcobinamide-phosphate guanylyltransferase
MNGGRLILIGGGVRSGKSAFALTRARRFGERLAFVATAQAFDDEMRARIKAHQVERESRFTTFAAPFDLPETVAKLDGFDAAVVDCLTLWLSNRLLRDEDPGAHGAAIGELAESIQRARCPVIVVTNEVGMGVVPPTRLGRTFRDLAGLAHQRLARDAEELYAAMMGVILRLRPGPVAVEARQ